MTKKKPKKIMKKVTWVPPFKQIAVSFGAGDVLYGLDGEGRVWRLDGGGSPVEERAVWRRIHDYTETP